ncbi:MAG: FtsW/RodA/SpoVE family cell cycle protein [Patescibacteria group bacterium]
MRRWIIFSIISALVAIGLATLKSVAADLFPRQLLFFGFGVGVFWFVSRIPFIFWLKMAKPLYIIVSALLLILLIWGKTTKGITAWFEFGYGLKFQPSQFAIFISSLFLLSKFDLAKELNFRQFIEILFWIAIPGLLILVEPDLGTAVIYFMSLLVLLIVSRAKKSWLVLTGLAGLVVALVGWQLVLKPYQKLRLTSFLAGYQVATDANYNVRQSLIAVGSGGLAGRGLGRGIQSHLRFLPERQTDFIFASFAEEWGFLGSAILLSLYVALILVVFNYSLSFSETKPMLFGLVLTFMLTVQIGINIGMNIGVMPITGITLPFLSYGGSSLLSNLILLGVFQGLVENAEQAGKRLVRIF